MWVTGIHGNKKKKKKKRAQWKEKGKSTHRELKVAHIPCQLLPCPSWECLTQKSSQGGQGVVVPPGDEAALSPRQGMLRERHAGRNKKVFTTFEFWSPLLRWNSGQPLTPPPQLVILVIIDSYPNPNHWYTWLLTHLLPSSPWEDAP